MRQVTQLFILAALFAAAFVNGTPPFGRTPNGGSVPIDGSESGIRELWRTTVATAIESWHPYRSHSFAEASTVSAPREGPLSAVYRATLFSAPVSKPCVPGGGKICQVASGSFAKVGEVHYAFNDSGRNIQGISRQVMVACHCLSSSCDLAILARPIDVFTHEADGVKRDTGERTCLYEAVDGKFSDCHSEVLQVTNRDRESVRDDTDENAFVYIVNNPKHGDFWNATGTRGVTAECLDTDIARLPTLNVSSLESDQVGIIKRRSSPPNNFCHGYGNVQYYRPTDPADGETCSRIYDKSMTVAAHKASQQDCFAVGKAPGTYLQPASVTLVTNTELALSCSTAVLGIVVLFSFYRKQMEKEKPTYVTIGLAVLFQVISYSLEALPLHTALGSEINARNWRSLFAFIDATLTLSKSGSARDGVLILSVVLGELQHYKTRVRTVAVLAAIFDLVALILIILTIVRKCGAIQTREVTDKEHSEISESESYCS